MFSSLADSSLYIPLCGCPLPSEVTLHVAVNKHSSKAGIALTIRRYALVCQLAVLRPPAPCMGNSGMTPQQSTLFQKPPHMHACMTAPCHAFHRLSLS